MIDIVSTSLLCSFGLTYFLVPPLLKLAEKKQLFDLPDHRKKHKHPIPSLGGVAIFAGFWTSVLLFAIPGDIASFKYFLVASLLLLLVGIYDDLVPIRASRKLILQLVIISLLYLGDFSIDYLFVALGIGALPPVLSYGATLIFFMVLINAYNLIDGVDGLAGSLGVLGASIFAGLFYHSGAMTWFIISTSLAFSLLAFLRYNFKNASMFMGDSGSMFIGVLMGVFGLEFLRYGGAEISVVSALPIIYAVSVIPVFDLLRVALTRMRRKKSPFAADRTHIHHLLLQAGLSPQGISISLVLLNLFMITFCIFATTISLFYSLLFLTVFTLSSFYLMLILLRWRQKLKQDVPENGYVLLRESN